MKKDIVKEIIEHGDYDIAVQLMDDELREDIHIDLAPCTKEEFLREYIKDTKKNTAKNFKYEEMGYIKWHT